MGRYESGPGSSGVQQAAAELLTTGTGPSDEEIKAAMEAAYSPSAGSPNPLGKTGMARESNTAGTADLSELSIRQAINNDSLNEIGRHGLRSHLSGKSAMEWTKLLETPTQQDPFFCVDHG